MSVKEAQARVMPDETSCTRCGHPTLQSIARPSGDTHLWFSFCPACRSVQDRASIPEWFLEGLPPPPDDRRLH